MMLKISLVAALLAIALPIVKSDYGRDSDRPHHDDRHHHGKRTTCTRTFRSTGTICCSSKTSHHQVTSPVMPPASTVVIPVVPCCTPFETVTSIPQEICSTVVLCGVDENNCKNESMHKLRSLA